MLEVDNVSLRTRLEILVYTSKAHFNFMLFFIQGSLITSDMAIQIAKQNPSLEYMIGVFDGDFGIEKQIRNEIKKFHPRFRQAVCAVRKSVYLALDCIEIALQLNIS